MSHHTFGIRVTEEAMRLGKDVSEIKTLRGLPEHLRLTMFTDGSTDVPLWLAVAIADELGADPTYLLLGDELFVEGIEKFQIDDARAFNRAAESVKASFDQKATVWEKAAALVSNRQTLGSAATAARPYHVWQQLFLMISRKRYRCSLHPRLELRSPLCPECGHPQNVREDSSNGGD